jgi:hypothetical protein
MGTTLRISRPILPPLGAACCHRQAHMLHPLLRRQCGPFQPRPSGEWDA